MSDGTKAKPTNMPVRKVQAGGLAGALVMIVMFILNWVNPNVEIPQGFEAALTTVFSFLVAYLVPPGSDEAVVLVQGAAKSAEIAPREDALALAGQA
jgi:hypothetical protein